MRGLAAILILFSLVLAGCGGGVSSQMESAPPPDPQPQPQPAASLQSVQHIIFMAQENRSFDNYFGKLNDYFASQGLPQRVDGLPPNAMNLGFVTQQPIHAFHFQTECEELLSPAWNESHRDVDRENASDPKTPMDGFAYSAGNFATNEGLNDKDGVRAMGYYDQSDIPFYYFMAGQFATSDRWFSPVMSRTQPNRMYLIAATSQGFTKPPTTTLKSKSIFQLLQEHNISWKVYVTDPGSTYISYFQPFASKHQGNVVPVSQYFSDVHNGTLPQVAMIESGYNSGRDEHPPTDIQHGAAYAAKIINALMQSQSWKDSVFILTYDEGGGFYDHVPPKKMPIPDGINPTDLTPADDPGTFDHTGFRVPLIVISPFTKKNYVSHTVADYTAILKFIETRFGLPSLNKRDAAQPDMTEFFDFKNVPWATPPSPPNQPAQGPCYFDHLP